MNHLLLIMILLNTMQKLMINGKELSTNADISSNSTHPRLTHDLCDKLDLLLVSLSQSGSTFLLGAHADPGAMPASLSQYPLTTPRASPVSIILTTLRVLKRHCDYNKFSEIYFQILLAMTQRLANIYYMLIMCQLLC